MSRREPAASRSSSSARSSTSRGSRPRSDGKVDVSCPQCGTQYRLPEASLDEKIECASCHRVFFPKTTVGKRAKAPDHTKTYVAFGIAGVAILGIFFAMTSGGGKPAKAPPPPVEKREVVGRGTHPRALQIVRWAQAMGGDNRLVIKTHNDLGALAQTLGVAAADEAALFGAISTHDSTRLLRELVADSATLTTDEAMTAPSGQAIVFVTPKPGTDDYKKNTRGEIEVSFRMDGEQVKVTAWQVKLPPVRNPNKPDPSKITYVPNKDIAKPEVVQVTDSAGTRQVKESKPTPVPHWEKATPAQQAKADHVVADIIRSADPESPGNLFNKATMSVQSLDDRKATVPRVLNAMYELYADVTANNMKLSQLNRALVGFTGFAVNYQIESTADPAKDKAARESCVRQWFAFWWRYSSGDLSEWIDMRENLDEPAEDPAKKKAGK